MNKRLLLMLLTALMLGASTSWAKPLDDVIAAEARGDHATALRILRPLAAKSDADAQFYLGWMYYQGLGVVQDYTEALKWFRLSAAQGNEYAQHNVGQMYSDGKGVVQDHAEAVKWYRLAAAQGSARAQSNLGHEYYEGLGVVQDYAEALKWFRLSAAQGNANGQNNLGAASGYADAVKNRDFIANQMTPQQIADAQKMARDCQKSNFKSCE